MKKSIKYLLITLISIFTFSISAYAKNMDKSVLLEYAQSVSESDISYIYVIGNYAFTSAHELTLEDMMLAARSIEVTGTAATTDMTTYTLNVIRDDDYVVTGLEYDDNFTGKGEPVDTFDIEYIDNESVEEYKEYKYYVDSEVYDTVIANGTPEDPSTNPAKTGYKFIKWVASSNDETVYNAVFLETVEDDENTVKVTSADDLELALECSSVTGITLTSNITLASTLSIDEGRELTIDLANNKIENSASDAYAIVSDGNLVIENGTITGDWGVDIEGGEATLSNVEISSVNRAISVSNATVTISDSTLSASSASNGTAVHPGENAILELTGVTVNAKQMAIGGNATEPLTKLSVINSTLTSEGEPAIFFPGTSKDSAIPELYVSGSTLTGLSGIEARSGKITIEDSKITATGTEANREYVKNNDTASGTTDGAAALWLHSQSPYNVGGTLTVNISNTELINQTEGLEGVIRVYEHATPGITLINIISDAEYTIANELKTSVGFHMEVSKTSNE